MTIRSRAGALVALVLAGCCHASPRGQGQVTEQITAKRSDLSNGGLPPAEPKAQCRGGGPILDDGAAQKALQQLGLSGAQMVATVRAGGASGQPVHWIEGGIVSREARSRREAAALAVCTARGWRLAPVLRSQFPAGDVFQLRLEQLLVVDRTGDGVPEVELRVGFLDSLSGDPPQGPYRRGTRVTLWRVTAEELVLLLEYDQVGETDAGVAVDRRSLQSANQWFRNGGAPALHVVQSVVITDDSGGEDGGEHGALATRSEVNEATWTWNHEKERFDREGRLWSVAVPGQAPPGGP